MILHSVLVGNSSLVAAAKRACGRRTLFVLAMVGLALSSGCGTVKEIGLRPIYVQTERDGTYEVRVDVPYRDDPAAHAQKHRLDLYLPHSGGFPMLAFVHGGSFENGDKGVSLAGLDIYRNIGRFYASRGVGVALINYRLQPEVRWPSQVDDVARATSWLARNLDELGGDGRLYLSGHSAGAWLVARVALDRDQLERPGVDLGELRGVISISGSGFDLTDRETWSLLGGPKQEELWAGRFDSGRGSEWRHEASVVPLIRVAANVPPFLIVYSSKELRALGRQNRLLHAALSEAGIANQLEVVDTAGHRRMALALSHPQRLLPELVLQFLESGAQDLVAAQSQCLRDAQRGHSDSADPSC